MEKFDKILDQLRDSSGELKDNMHMLSEIVPVEEQMKYFQFSKYIQKDKEKDSLDKHYLIARLFTPEVSIENKRYYLSVLAGIVDVAAYRALEAYHSNPLDPELKYWSALALAESKILLDAEFSGEKQFFVSTGLGGIGKKLRFFGVIATLSRKDFTSFQQETLIRELQFQFEKNEIDVELLEYKGNYLKMLLLCGLNHDARLCIQEAIDEANEFGDYIDPKFILTNIKPIDDDEIVEVLKKEENIESYN